MKVARKREQELNVQKRKTEKEKHKQKCLQGMGIVTDQGKAEVDNDIDWYREEVGEDPDEDTFKSEQSEYGVGGRKRGYTDYNNRTDSLLRKPRISKFTKVKEKIKLLKKQKQLGRTGRDMDSRGNPNFQKLGSGNSFENPYGRRSRTSTYNGASRKYTNPNVRNNNFGKQK